MRVNYYATVPCLASTCYLLQTPIVKRILSPWGLLVALAGNITIQRRKLKKVSPSGSKYASFYPNAPYINLTQLVLSILHVPTHSPLTTAYRTSHWLCLPLLHMQDGHDCYSRLNLMVRRVPKENNFKSVLETIRDLMNTPALSRAIPAWLHDVFLGYGSPKAANYRYWHTHYPSSLPSPALHHATFK